MSNSSENFSRTFYPFLHDDHQTPGELREQLRFSLNAKARESIEVKERFFAEQQETILNASLALARSFSAGRKLLVCGNG